MSVAPAEGDGWSLRPLRLFPDERGAVLHMLRASDAPFERFGEIYFSTIRQGVVKAWHLHRTKTINLAVPIGAVRVVVWREGGTAQELTFGREATGSSPSAPASGTGSRASGPGNPSSPTARPNPTMRPRAKTCRPTVRASPIDGLFSEAGAMKRLA